MPHLHLKNILFSRQTRMVLLSAFPKSASQHMLYQLETSFDKMHTIRAKTTPGDGHNYLSKSRLRSRLNVGKTNILYGHYPLNRNNRRIIQHFAEKRALISIRSLPDVVISYRDHMISKKSGPLDWGVKNAIECHPRFKELADTGQFDFIISFVVPWYLRYLQSWLVQRDLFPVRFVTFEAQTSDTQSLISRVGEYLQLELKPARTQQDEKKPVRVNFNKGLSGRGKELLAQNQIDKIAQLIAMAGLDHYPSLCDYLINGESNTSRHITLSAFWLDQK